MPTAAPTLIVGVPTPGSDQPGAMAMPERMIVAVQAFADDLVGPSALPATKITGSGARVVRLPVQWRWIEPERQDPPFYQWGDYGNAISAVSGMGLEVMAVVYTKPVWASSDGCGPVDRAPLSAYGDYIRALVERFDGDGRDDAPGSPRIAYWEIENEPDFSADPAQNGGLASYGSCFGGSRAGDFAELMRTAYRAAKEADASATVILGGVAFDRFYNRPGRGWQGPFDHDFLRNMLIRGQAAHPGDAAWPWFDWLGLHAYDSFRVDWPGEVPADNGLPAKLQELRRSQLLLPGVFDLRDKPIALTEVGLSSHPSDAWTVRSEAQQAMFTGRILADARAQGIAMVSWFLLRDRDPGLCDDPQSWVTWGLLRSRAIAQAAAACAVNPLPAGYPAAEDGAAKPAWQALAVASRQLEGLRYDASPGPDAILAPGTRAYRYRDPQTGAYRVVAFADNGERLGRANTAAAVGRLQVGRGLLPDWTGRVRVTDHLGRPLSQISGESGLTLGPDPVYLEAIVLGAPLRGGASKRSGPSRD